MNNIPARLGLIAVALRQSDGKAARLIADIANELNAAPSPSLGEPCQHPAYKLYPVHFGREGTAHWCKVCGALRHGTGNLWMIPASPTAAQGQKAVAWIVAYNPAHPNVTLPSHTEADKNDPHWADNKLNWILVKTDPTGVNFKYDLEPYGDAVKVTPLFACPVPASGEGWVKCSERMPEDGLEVLISPAYNINEITGTHWDEHWNFSHSSFIDDAESGVTHWMPVPAAPRVTE